MLAWVLSSTATGMAPTPYYAGKTITIVAGTKAGDVYDLYARHLKIIVEAFERVLTEEAALADAKKKQLEIDPSAHDELELLAMGVTSQLPEIVPR